jgi:Zn2+/Cd2+-exporting ATPase
VSIVAALAGAARRGILVKGGVHLENLGRVRTFMLDKTGTLTYGRPSVIEIISTNSHTADEVLSIAASVESHSEHLLAEAIVRHATEQRVAFDEGRESRALPGRGAEARVDGRLCHVGNLRLVEELSGESDGPEAGFVSRFERAEVGGRTAVAVIADGRPLGIIVLLDQPREAAADTVRELRDLGMSDVVMLTGDNRQTAESIAGQVGIENVHAALLPDEKLEKVRELTERHRWTAMVGDGVNDAPALAAATVGIAMGAAGSDVAIETADVALMADRLDRLPQAVSLGRRTLSVIRQNISIALTLKAIFFVLAVANLATLWMAVLADMGASLIVIANGLRLLGRRK